MKPASLMKLPVSAIPLRPHHTHTDWSLWQQETDWVHWLLGFWTFKLLEAAT